MSIEIKIVPTGLLDVNTALVFNTEHNKAVIIDPGGSEDYLYKFLTDRNLELDAILLTHAHFDHTAGSSGLISKSPDFFGHVKIYMHRDDLPLWEFHDKQGGMFGIPVEPHTVSITDFLEPGNVLRFQGFELQVLHTPGHSPGSCSFYLESAKAVFSGDVIFQGSIGRTDLWQGNFDTLMVSIRNKILTLPDDTKIYSGHGPVTTVGDEKRSNPFLAG